MDRYPGKRLADLLDETHSNDPVWVDQLIDSVETYLEKIDRQDMQKMEEVRDDNITDSGAFRIFRGYERTQNIKLILQHLIAFLRELPCDTAAKVEVIDPFKQFKRFVREYVDLLKEPDVRRAILRIQEELGILKEANRWYYEGRIDKWARELDDTLEKARKPDARGYRALFETVQKLSLFWFTVKNESMDRVRRSDVYMYQLAKILLRRCDGV